MQRRWKNRAALSLAGLFALAGCAGSQLQQEVAADRQVFNDNNDQVELSQTEGMLTNTGFRQIPASTPDQKRQLLALPPYKLVAQPHDDGMRYVYADAAVCNCIYVGNEAAYHRFLDLNQAQDIADDLGMATGGASEAAVFDWGTWETATQ